MVDQSFFDPCLQLAICSCHLFLRCWLIFWLISLFKSGSLTSEGFAVRISSLFSISLAASVGSALKVLGMRPAGMNFLEAFRIVWRKNFSALWTLFTGRAFTKMFSVYS